MSLWIYHHIVRLNSHTLWAFSLAIHPSFFSPCDIDGSAAGLIRYVKMTATFPFAEMTAVAGPFKGVDRQGHVFLIVRLGEMGKLPLCACWTSRSGVRSPLLGEGWSLPLLESRLVPSERSEVDFVQPDGFVRTLTRGRKDSRNLSSGVWFGREDGEGDVRLSADFGSTAGKIDVAFRGGRLVSLRCAEGSFGFSYRERVISKVTGDGGALLTVERDARNAERIVFRLPGRTAVCERNGNTLTIVAADGSRHAFVQGMDGEDATLDADGVVCRWDRYTGKALSVGDWSYRVGECSPPWNNAPITRTHADGRSEEYWFNRANGKGSYRTPEGDLYRWARFPAGELYGLMRWSEKTRGTELLHRHDYTYDGNRRRVFHRLRRGAFERQNGALPELEETWYAPDGKVRRVRVDGKEAKL